jgi:two-component system OmpR family sensor kinase
MATTEVEHLAEPAPLRGDREVEAAAEEATAGRGEPARVSPLAAVRARLQLVPASLRTRVIAWFIGVLALATLASVLVTREVLLIRLDQRIDGELVQESEELRRFARGNDPATGRPFGSDVGRILEVYLQRNVPSRNEALISFVGGQPFLRSRQVVPYRLDTDPELVARWGAVRESGRGQVETPAGRVDYVAIPLRGDQETQGVFVAAIFYDRWKEEADDAVWATGAVGLVFLLLGSLVAWRLAGRVVGPVAALTRAARTISATDLSLRIPVRGRDEVAQLASTFNEMLERLRRAFESQRQFVDDAGHELRTPLTIIRGHLELLEYNPRDQPETLAVVVDELDRMGRMVDDLLLLTRHEQPDFLDLDTVEVDVLTESVRAKVTALGPREWVFENLGRGMIVADRQRLTQAVLELAENAVRYSAADKPIALGSRVADGEARFWVRDGGPGIPPEERNRIFERFRRGAGPRRSEGAGLGLAIVKAIAEAHHGRVDLHCGPGGETSFTLIVPVDQPNPEEAKTESAAS